MSDIQRYVKEKGRNGIISLDPTADSLLDFIDKENTILYKNLVLRDRQE